MKYQNLISQIEDEWEQPNGALGLIRLGQFDEQKSRHLLELLKSIKLGKKDCFSRRFVSLIWYIPAFLEWQVDRVQEEGVNTKRYAHFVNQVRNEVERILGVP